MSHVYMVGSFHNDPSGPEKLMYVLDMIKPQVIVTEPFVMQDAVMRCHRASAGVIGPVRDLGEHLASIPKANFQARVSYELWLPLLYSSLNPSCKTITPVSGALDRLIETVVSQLQYSPEQHHGSDAPGAVQSAIRSGLGGYKNRMVGLYNRQLHALDADSAREARDINIAMMCCSLPSPMRWMLKYMDMLIAHEVDQALSRTDGAVMTVTGALHVFSVYGNLAQKLQQHKPKTFFLDPILRKNEEGSTHMHIASSPFSVPD